MRAVNFMGETRVVKGAVQATSKKFVYRGLALKQSLVIFLCLRKT